MQIPRLSLISCGLHTAWVSITGAIFALMLTQAAQAVTVSLYSENGSGCPNQSFCEVPLLLIPANRALTVTNVSCVIVHGSQTVEILYTQLIVANSANQAKVRDAVVPVLTGKGSLGSYFSFNQQTTLVLAPSQRLLISIATDAISSFFIQCKIAGDWRVV
jgi:hypothetical protein